ncbi:hypothetical protein GJ744_007417 [Endocarpon pusillum]|uniref:Uncharacterized protein n=1 Tax=Endocarpon pusillum TaxID=364733 RepID=A0A8H7E7M7_9EURO|nr:hypothetical protein GJ744_007417 [Endocarpon pusillum]
MNETTQPFPRGTDKTPLIVDTFSLIFSLCKSLHNMSRSIRHSLPPFRHQSLSNFPASNLTTGPLNPPLPIPHSVLQ